MCSRGVVCFQRDMDWIFKYYLERNDRLCGLAVRVPGYRSGGIGFDSRRYQIFWQVVGLERGPLSLVSAIEELPVVLGEVIQYQPKRWMSRIATGRLLPFQWSTTLSTAHVLCSKTPALAFVTRSASGERHWTRCCHSCIVRECKLCTCLWCMCTTCS
jgi:hypothetical protein